MSRAKTSLSRIAGLSVIVLLLGGLGIALTVLGDTTSLRIEAANKKPVCENFKTIHIEDCGTSAWLRQANKCKIERRNVQINLSSGSTKEMRFKEIDPKTNCNLTDDTGWTDWEDFAVEKDFKLSGGYGNKKVCVALKNDIGESRCYGNVKYVQAKPTPEPTPEPTAGSVGGAPAKCPANTDCDNNNEADGVVKCQQYPDGSINYCCPSEKPQLVNNVCSKAVEYCKYSCKPASSCTGSIVADLCGDSTNICCKPKPTLKPIPTAKPLPVCATNTYCGASSVIGTIKCAYHANPVDVRYCCSAAEPRLVNTEVCFTAPDKLVKLQGYTLQMCLLRLDNDK